MKLKSLKSSLQVAGSRLQSLATPTVERKRGSTGVRDRERIKKRDCGLCQECKRSGKVNLGRVVDHIEPLWKGGSDEELNKELLCDPCHDAKTAREAAERGRDGW
jgi:5-methylcytosine-specific restriction enzyme A